MIYEASQRMCAPPAPIYPLKQISVGKGTETFFSQHSIQGNSRAGYNYLSRDKDSTTAMMATTTMLPGKFASAHQGAKSRDEQREDVVVCNYSSGEKSIMLAASQKSSSTSVNSMNQTKGAHSRRKRDVILKNGTYMYAAILATNSRIKKNPNRGPLSFAEKTMNGQKRPGRRCKPFSHDVKRKGDCKKMLTFNYALVTAEIHKPLMERYPFNQLARLDKLM